MNTHQQSDDLDKVLAEDGISPDTPIKMFNNRLYRTLTGTEKLKLLREKAVSNPHGPTLASCFKDVTIDITFAEEKRAVTEKVQMNAAQANKDAAEKWKTYADNNHERFNDKTSLDTAEELIKEMRKINNDKKEYMERDKKALEEALKQAKCDEEVRKILEQNKSNAQTGEKDPRQDALPFPRIPSSAGTVAEHIAKLRRRRPIN